MWKCPKCFEEMHDHDDQCWNCRMRNPALPPKPDTPAQAGDETAGLMAGRKKRCPYCAEEIREEAIKCRFCGSVLPGAARPPVSVSQPARPGRSDGDYIRIPKRAALAAVIVCCLAAAAASAWALFRSGSLKIGGKKPAVAAAGEKKGGYEEIIEYDARGNVKKSMKKYDKPQ